MSYFPNLVGVPGVKRQNFSRVKSYRAAFDAVGGIRDGKGLYFLTVTLGTRFLGNVSHNIGDAWLIPLVWRPVFCCIAQNSRTIWSSVFARLPVAGSSIRSIVIVRILPV